MGHIGIVLISILTAAGAAAPEGAASEQTDTAAPAAAPLPPPERSAERGAATPAAAESPATEPTANTESTRTPESTPTPESTSAPAPLPVVESTAAPDSTAAASDGDGPSAAAEESIPALEDLLDMYVATGSFLDLDISRSPASLTIITRQQIEASGARHLGELLEIFVPGFQYVVNKWNGDLWGMRGVAADRNTKFIFAVNGIKLNHETRDGAYAETTLGLLGDIERVEVLRGPAAIVYGSGAIAGVVNVVTRRPEQNSAQVTAGYGRWETFQAEGLAHLQLDKRESLTISAGYRQSDGAGLRHGRVYGVNQWPTDGAPSPAGEPTDGSPWAAPGNIRASLDWQFGDLRVYSRITRRQEPVGAYFIVDPWPEYVGAVPGNADPKVIDGEEIGWDDPLALTESFGSNRRLHVVDGVSVGAFYDLPVGADRATIEAEFKGVTNRIVAEPREGYGSTGDNGTSPPGHIESSMGERRYLVGLRYLLRRFEPVQSAFGFEYRFDDLGKDLSGLNVHGLSTHPEITAVHYQNVAFYTENLVKVHDMFSVVAALRADDHTRTNWVLSPKFGAILTLNDANVVRFLFQTASNNGSVDNYEYNWRQYGDDGTIIERPHLEIPENPTSGRIFTPTVAELRSLEPERATSLELTSTHRLLRTVTLMPSISYTRFTNLFTWNEDLFRVINAGEYDAFVAEGEVRYEDSSLLVGLNHCYQRPFSDTRETTTVSRPATQVVDNGDGTYDLVVIDGAYDQFEVSSVRDQISVDGSSFLNLTTNITKLFVIYTPWPRLTLQTSMRVFWPFAGRRSYYDADEALGDNYLGIQDKPMVKWNLGAIIHLPERFELSLQLYDILGTARNRHAARWQQMAVPTQRDLYTVDQITFAAVLGHDM